MRGRVEVAAAAVRVRGGAGQVEVHVDSILEGAEEKPGSIGRAGGGATTAAAGVRPRHPPPSIGNSTAVAGGRLGARHQC